MNNIYVLVIGMTIVTYIPRLMPFFMLSDKKMPNQFEKFLKLIPYTALGALIFPGVIYAIPNLPLVSLIALVAAFTFAWKIGGIITPVIGSIGITFVILLIIK